MEIVFADSNKDVIHYLQYYFNITKDDKIKFRFEHKSILDIENVDIYVCPGNGFGVMTSGISLEYRNAFGIELQDKIQHEIFFNLMQSKLSIGEAVHIEIPNFSKKFMIYTPTSIYSCGVSETENAKRSFIEILNRLKRLSLRFPAYKSIKMVCPGLCTGPGGMILDRAAKQMLEAYTYFRWWEDEQRSNS